MRSAAGSSAAVAVVGHVAAAVSSLASRPSAALPSVVAGNDSCQDVLKLRSLFKHEDLFSSKVYTHGTNSMKP